MVNIHTLTPVIDTSYSLDLSGYHEIAVIDIIEATTSYRSSDVIDAQNQVFANSNQIINSANVDITNDSISSSADYSTAIPGVHCTLNANINLDFKFELPDFFSNPGVNLSLFNKADEFSSEISQLNDTLIKIIQQLNCCGMSTEYNKTVIPIFRYLADNNETIGCGIDPKLQGQTCATGSGIMKTILQTVTTITKIYTAIEPIFCLVAPIPGNPWLPFDFNWKKPVYGIMAKFERIIDDIMSGSIFDLIINPTRALRKTLDNCAMSMNTYNSKPYTVEYLKELETDSRKLGEYIIPPFSKAGEAIVKDYNGIQEDDNKLYPPTQTSSRFPITEMKNFKNLNNETSGICNCLTDVFDMRIAIPRYPCTDIRGLPDNKSELTLSSRNDLTKVLNTISYDITKKDIFGKSVSNANDEIYFNDNFVYDWTSVTAFKKYITTDSGDGGGSQTHHYISANDLTESFKKVDKNLSSFSGTIKTEIEKETDSVWTLGYWKTINQNGYRIATRVNELVEENLDKPTETSGSTNDILKENRKIIKLINDFEIIENNYLLKLKAIQDKDRTEWMNAKNIASGYILKMNKSYDYTEAKDIYNKFFGHYSNFEPEYDPLNIKYSDGEINKPVKLSTDDKLTSFDSLKICRENYIASRQANYDNFLNEYIQMLVLEKKKVIAFETLDNNVAYELRVKYFPKIPCDCNIVCELLQMIITFILGKVQELIKWVIQKVIEIIIPEWVNTLIRLILYKLKCIMEIVYMKENMDSIDDAYKNLLESIKGRVNLYPYDACAKKALDNLTTPEEVEVAKTLLGTSTDIDTKSLDHNLKIEVLNKYYEETSLFTKEELESAFIRITFDSGASITKVSVTDDATSAPSTIIYKQGDTGENISLTSRLIIQLKDNEAIKNILSGQIKVTAESYKINADHPNLSKSTSFKIIDALNDTGDGLGNSVYLSARDFITKNYETLLSENKNTLEILYSCDNLWKFVFTDTNTNPLIDTLRPVTVYSDDIKEDNFIFNCNNIFPNNRMLNITMYYGTDEIKTTQTTIFCKVIEGTTTTQNETYSELDVLTFSPLVEAETAKYETDAGLEPIPFIDSTSETRESNPIIYNCTRGPNALINTIIKDFVKED